MLNVVNLNVRNADCEGLRRGHVSCPHQLCVSGNNETNFPQIEQSDCSLEEVTLPSVLCLYTRSLIGRMYILHDAIASAAAVQTRLVGAHCRRLHKHDDEWAQEPRRSQRCICQSWRFRLVARDKCFDA